MNQSILLAVLLFVSFEYLRVSKATKWYEKIQISYSSEFKNVVRTNDSVLWKEEMIDDMKYGYSHGVPFSTNLKFLKVCNLTPGLSYKGVAYASKTIKYYDAAYVDPDNGRQGRVVDSIIPGFNYAHSVNPSLGLSVDPTIYGMYRPANPNSNIIAVRHVIKPSASFRYVPDVNKLGIIKKELYYKEYNYYDAARDTNLTKEYSIYDGYIYGTPLGPGESGSFSFSLRNNIEMKVRTPKDTAQDEKKIKIIDVLDFSTGLNPFTDKKETAQWSTVSAVVSSSFFNGKFNPRIRGVFNQYSYTKDSLGAFIVDTEHPWTDFRLTSASFTLGTSFKSKQKSSPKTGEEIENDEVIEEEITEQDVYNDYVDFSIPWDFRVDYSFNYSKPYDNSTKRITQTLSFSGNLSLTPKWKIGFRSGYDIEAKEFTYTSLNIFRDLHCWEMKFSVVPFGYRQNYNFMINIKTPILRDLKYEKKQSWYDKNQF